MGAKMTYRLFYIIIVCLFGVLTPIRAGGEEVLDRMIQLPKSRETVYKLLDQVSRQTGYLFIYDSQLINNEQVVRLKSGTRSVRQAIYEIVGNTQLALRVIGNHILIYHPTEVPVVIERARSIPDSVSYFTIEGVLRDRYSQEPISYGTVSVVGSSVGSVTNQNGAYRLRLPETSLDSLISFSHLGYVSQTIEASVLAGQNRTLTLEPKVIPLQEVIIRVANPLRIVREMLESREKNYARHPVYFTSFYREGIERNHKFVTLTEAVFKVYKTSYLDVHNADQVKLLKMRSISNRLEKDTFVTKMKSGIDACLQLDLIKNLPDFLDPSTRDLIYVYTSSDLTVINNRVANVICFEQRKTTTDPLFTGKLFIDADNNALLQAQFEINPRYVTHTADIFVEKKARDMSITPLKVLYTVSYKPWKDTYYISHVRGDLSFKVKKKKRLFGSFLLHTWFEMATCKIDTEQVVRFGRKEKLSTRTVFADTSFEYDQAFWEDFNVIPPEEVLTEAIEKLSSKIEETTRDDMDHP